MGSGGRVSGPYRVGVNSAFPLKAERDNVPWMMEPIALEFEILPGAPGWATCTVRSGPRSVGIGPFSHVLSDGLDDLVRAATTIVSGAGQQTFSMDAEPEPRWEWSLNRNSVSRSRPSELEVTITRFDDVTFGIGEEVLRTVCDPDDFGRAVVSAIKAMMASESPESLRRRWSRLPERALASLESALDLRRH